MNGNTRQFWIGLVLVGILVLVPGYASAAAERTNWTGTENSVAMLDPGDWSNPGGNIHVRGMVNLYQEQATDPRVTGSNTVVMNANWNANWVGPMWGTWRLETAYGGGGVWEGHWTGETQADGSAAYQAVGHGVSGSVKGLKVMISAEDPADPALPTVTSGTIHEPHGP